MTDTRFYIVDLPKCQCGKTATVEIKNNWNASMGLYCKPCGNRQLKWLQERG